MNNTLIGQRRLIEVYKFKHNGITILLDVNRVNCFEINELTSGFIDVLQGRLVYEDFISLYSERDIVNIINDLENNGFFNHEFTDEISGHDDLNDISTNQVIENLVVNISNDCNLRCLYCFANTGTYNGMRDLMDSATAERTLEWFVRQSKGKDKLNLHFFGGEPLMNVDLVNFMADYAHKLEKKYEKKIFLNICTNGTILNKNIINTIKKYTMGVQISIDGPRFLHDKFRPYPQGAGSYDKISKNVNKLLMEIPTEQLIARATIPHGSIHVNDVIEHLFGMGFSKVAFVPAMGCGKWSIEDEDIEDIRIQYAILADTYIKHRRKCQNFHIFPFASEVDNVSNGVKKMYGCGAGLGFASVSIDGKIYPCMRFTDNETYCIGDIYKGLNSISRDKVINRAVEQRLNCSSCWARYLCGGACIAVSAEKNIGIEPPDPIGCHMAKLVARLAIYVNAKLTSEGIEPVEKCSGDFDFIRRRFQ